MTIKNSTIAANTTAAGPDGAPGAVSGTGRGGNASSAGAGGSGGGIESSGPLVISGTTFVGNRTGRGGNGGLGGNGTGADGGGIGTGGGTGGSGGAIDSTADMTISNSTIVANAAAGGGAAGVNGTPSGPGGPGPGLAGTGGAINQRAMGTTLTHVTITANSAAGVGGGVDGAGGTVTIGNSIVAGNVATAPNLNCAGVLVDQGGNIEFAASSCPAGFLQANPKLTGLADNGGPTQTIALQAGSAADRPRSHLRPWQRSARSLAPGWIALRLRRLPGRAPVRERCLRRSDHHDECHDCGGDQPEPARRQGRVNFGRTRELWVEHAAAGSWSRQCAGFVRCSDLPDSRPNTTYHFDVVATNADGQTTTSDGVFTTLPPLTASIAQASTVGPALRLTIACGGGFGPGTCAGPISPRRARPASTVTR